MAAASSRLLSSTKHSASSLGTANSREATSEDAVSASLSSSRATVQRQPISRDNSMKFLRIRNPTPSSEPLDSTVVVKVPQTFKALTGVSSFGALGADTGSLYDTQSTSEDLSSCSTAEDLPELINDPEDLARNRTQTEPSNEQSDSEPKPCVKSKQPLKHWVRQLRQRHLQKKRALKVRKEREPLCSPDDSEADESPQRYSSHKRHRKSSSWASSAFVTAMKSTTISLASFPTANQRRSQGSDLLGNDFRIKYGVLNARRSTDRSSETTGSNDREALTRAALRQHTLYEMMSTEASYIEDLKALVSTYRLIMDLTPADSTVDVHRCILGILELHEALLDRLRELGMGVASQKPPPLRKKLSMKLSNHIHNEAPGRSHQRSRSSNDALMSSSNWASKDRCSFNTSVMEPNDAARVANIFNDMLGRFFVYEEYAATYTTMMRYLSTKTSQITGWQSFERGLEVLVNRMAPLTLENRTKNKPMTYGDLLIKPIQRICKYPLLLSDLLKHTPVIDDPESHALIEKTLHRLHETTEEINKATNDEYTREKIDRSWKLQDMLVFSTATSTPFALRSLGRVELCGALYACYQSSTTVTGDYMLCALFKSNLLLAKPVWGTRCIRSFSIVACVDVIDLRLETADKGKGLRCSNAPFTWKLVFESGQKFYEMILCACSDEEERQWKSQITGMAAENRNNMHLERRGYGPDDMSLLALDIEPIGNAFLARRLSIQRASENGGRLRTRQVIIKNTHSPNEQVGDDPSVPSISRSRSLLSGSCHTTILCPRRSTRICIEQEMCKVWSKEFLPYPAMTTTRETKLRRSASHVMKKLSKSSLSGSVGKRNFTGTNANPSENDITHEEGSGSRLNTRAGSEQYLENRATNLQEDFLDRSSAAVLAERPRVQFTKDVLRKLPQRSASVRENSPQILTSSRASPSKKLTRVSSLSLERLGSLFKLGSLPK